MPLVYLLRTLALDCNRVNTYNNSYIEFETMLSCPVRAITQQLRRKQHNQEIIIDTYLTKFESRIILEVVYSCLIRFQHLQHNKLSSDCQTIDKGLSMNVHRMT